MWYISPFDFRAIFIRGKKLIRKLLAKLYNYMYTLNYILIKKILNSAFKVDDCVILTEDTS